MAPTTATTPTPPLLRKLLAIQQRHHLSDRAFAKRLGISWSLWSKTRKQAYPIRYEVLAGAAQAFPELGPDLVAYLQESDRTNQKGKV